MENQRFMLRLMVCCAFMAAGGCDDSNKDESEDTGTTKKGDTECKGISDLTVGILEREIELEGDTINKKVNTVLMVNWDQTEKTDSVKLRFTFENDDWYESPAEPGETGNHEIPVLGVPELTDVTIHIVNETDDEETVCETSGTTGEIPESVPRPTIREYDPSLASENRWMLGAVEKTPDILGMYEGVFTVYVMDRQGRIVWYYLDQAFSPITAYPRIARDGTHFYFDRSTYLGMESGNRPSIVRTTLDFRQFEQIDAPSMTDSMDITDDGSFVYNSDEWLIELMPDGTEQKVWNCRDWSVDAGIKDIVIDLKINKYKMFGKPKMVEKLKQIGKMDPEKFAKYFDVCYANSVVFNPLENSVLLSFPYTNTVVEISRESGELIGQWGDAIGSWQIEPETTKFVYEHGANITPDGTLLVSTRESGANTMVSKPAHYFLEFELDQENQIASEIWRFGEGYTDWPAAKGEVFPVDGGNRLCNYGTAGIIREITPDLKVAWDVKFDTEFELPPEIREIFDESYSEDDINNMVGHNILIDDLYALIQGWESE